MLSRRHALAVLAIAGSLAASGAAFAQEKLRFAVGPFQPTASDTKKAYEPFFKHLAEKLGRAQEAIDYFREFLRARPEDPSRAAIEARVRALRAGR